MQYKLIINPPLQRAGLMGEMAVRDIRACLIIESHNFRLQERLGGRRGSCDVAVLGPAAFASGEDYRHERRTKEAARTVGDAVGRRARRTARAIPAPGRQEPSQHVRVPARAFLRRHRFLQRVRKGVMPRLRVWEHREGRACQDGAPAISLQGVRQALHAGDGNYIRGSQAAALRMVGLPGAAVLPQQLRVYDQGGQEERYDASVLDGKALSRARRRAGWHRAIRPGPNRRDVFPRHPPRRRHGRRQAAARALPQPDVHRDRLRRGSVGLPVGGVRKDELQEDHGRIRRPNPEGLAPHSRQGARARPPGARARADGVRVQLQGGLQATRQGQPRSPRSTASAIS